MRICRLDDWNPEELIEHIQKGSIIIYPTDTIYGIGCNALKPKSVRLIRKLKKTDHPFSVIAPSKGWVNEHAKIRHRSYLTKLPGRYTFIVEKRKPRFLKDCAPGATLGVRIPRHPFTTLVQKAGVPFVTTSANISGKRPIKRIARIPHSFLRHIAVVVNDGTLDKKASTIFDLTTTPPKRIR